jgi:hypothetical protein
MSARRGRRTTPTETTPPPFGGRAVYLIRVGGGTKLVVRAGATPSGIRVWSWRHHSRRWTKPQTIAPAAILGPADVGDRRYKAALAAWEPDGSGPIQRAAVTPEPG